MKFLPEIKEIKSELIIGENSDIMKCLIENGFQGSFQLIYFDGPFNSGLIYSDRNQPFDFEYTYPWSQYDSIINYMKPERYLESYKERIKLAWQLLREDGFFVLQTNQLFAHHMKVIIEEVFGRENMLPEVIWKHSPTPWPVLAGYSVGYQHESIFFYSKSEKFSLKNNLHSLFPSVWDDIPGYLMEESDYPTQKPEKLMKRILEITTEDGDLVGDFYCGSGTFPYVAEKMRRKWVSCDNSHQAIQVTNERLLHISNSFQIHQVEDEYHPDYVKEHVYTKQTKSPLSLYELESLKRHCHVDEVHAYQFASDVDLVNDEEQFKFYYLFPLITEDGFSESEGKKLARPIPAKEEDGYRLNVENPLEWVLYHLIFVERNELQLLNVSKYDTEYHHIFHWEKTVNKAKEVVNRVNNHWITKVVEQDEYVHLTDIFGYQYKLSTK